MNNADVFGNVVIQVVKKFRYTNQKAQSFDFLPGMHMVKEEVADHWYVKLHLEEPPASIPAPGSQAYAEQKRAAAAQKEIEEAEAAQRAREEAEKFAAERDAAVAGQIAAEIPAQSAAALAAAEPPVRLRVAPRTK